LVDRMTELALKVTDQKNWSSLDILDSTAKKTLFLLRLPKLLTPLKVP